MMHRPIVSLSVISKVRFIRLLSVLLILSLAILQQSHAGGRSEEKKEISESPPTTTREAGLALNSTEVSPFLSHADFVQVFQSDRLKRVVLVGPIGYRYRFNQLNVRALQEYGADEGQIFRMNLDCSLEETREPPKGWEIRTFKFEIRNSEGENASEAVGEIILQELANSTQSKTLYLEKLSIKKNLQGKSYSVAALQELVRYLDRSRILFESISLYVDSDKNYTGLIYAKAGFRPPALTIQTLAKAMNLTQEEIETHYLNNSNVRYWPILTNNSFQVFGETLKTQHDRNKVASSLEYLNQMIHLRNQPFLDIEGVPSFEQLKTAIQKRNTANEASEQDLF